VRPPVDDVVLETVIFAETEDKFAFPTASLNELEATLITAVPPLDVDAVKVAVYVVPLPEKLLSVPKVTETSVESNVVVDSETVNVIVDVAPEAREVGLDVIVIVGAAVS
jgi:hypothetical protein